MMFFVRVKLEILSPQSSPSTGNYPTKPWIDSGSCDVLAISKLRRRHGELRGLCFDGGTAKSRAAWLRKDDGGCGSSCSWYDECIGLGV